MLNLVGRLSGIATLTREYVRARRRHRRTHLRHAQNHARLAAPGKVRRPLRRRPQPPHRPVRRDSHQRQPPRAGGRKQPVAGRRRPPCPRFPGPTRCAIHRLKTCSSKSKSIASNNWTMCSPPGRISCCSITCRLRCCGPPSARRNERAPHIELEASGGVKLETVREIAVDWRRTDQRRRPHAFGALSGHRPRLVTEPQ